MLRAFAELVRHDRPNALLLLNDWGLEVGRSRSLIAELGIERNVRWLEPLPKLKLIDAYRAADVVLDQFLIGTFGAVAPEAMACGTPVLMAFEPSMHEWCFPELPPIVDVREPEQIYRELRRLARDEEARAELGASGGTGSSGTMAGSSSSTGCWRPTRRSPATLRGARERAGLPDR